MKLSIDQDDHRKLLEEVFLSSKIGRLARFTTLGQGRPALL